MTFHHNYLTFIQYQTVPLNHKGFTILCIPVTFMFVNNGFFMKLASVLFYYNCLPYMHFHGPSFAVMLFAYYFF